MVCIGNTGHISATAPRAYGVPRLSPSSALPPLYLLTHMYLLTHCTFLPLKGPEIGGQPRPPPPRTNGKFIFRALEPPGKSPERCGNAQRFLD